MRFIELFAGIGGFRYGLERVQFENEKLYKPTSTVGDKEGQFEQQFNRSNERLFTCVYANEWDYDPYKKEKQYAWKIYQKQFGKKELDTRNIEDVPAESIPNFDLLTAGFPCQGFSIAGKRKGMSGEDTKGSEFYEVYRIAKERHPQLLLLENVPGLFSSRGGKDFLTILKSLDEIGYDVEWDCINTSVFLPQNRLRVFIIGHLRGTGGQKVFPIGEGNQIYSECETKKGQRRSVRPDPAMSELTSRWREAKNLVTKEDQAKCLSATCYKGIGNDGMTLIRLNEKSDGRDREIKRIYDPKGLAPTLHLKTGGWQEPKIKVMNTLTEATGNRAGSSKEFLRSVNNINSAIGQVRRLTPTECERLQGFPDGWTEGISDSQRYRCLGNAVTTNVVEEIGKRIINVQQRIF